MSYCYLLDTNILSDLVKHPTGKIFSKIQSIGEEKVCTSVVVAPWWYHGGHPDPL